MESLRRAALAVHGLEASDRAWLLGELTAGSRARLEPLLGELTALGIPAMASLGDAARPAPATPPMQKVPIPAGPLERLRVAEISRLRAVLSREHDEVIAACLAIEEWPWRNEFLASYPRERRERIAAAIRRHANQAPAPKLRESLLESLDGRVALATPVPGIFRRTWLRVAKR